MLKKAAADSDSSLLFIDPDDFQLRDTKLLLRRRRKRFNLLSDADAKQPGIYNKNSYESPLMHLGRTKDRNTRSMSLDDSVIVLEELPRSQAPSCPSKNTYLCPEHSIIILSDNEGESKSETAIEQRNCEIPPKDDSSEKNLKLAEIKVADNSARKKKVKTRCSSHLAPRAKLKTKTIANKLRSPQRKYSSKLCSKSKILEPESVSIDSEDENTIPNDGFSKLNPQVEIIIIDNSPDTEANEDVSPSTSKAVIEGDTKNDEVASHSTESSSRSVTSGCKITRKRLRLAQKSPECNELLPCCIDKTGDPSLYKSKKPRANATSSVSSFVKEQNVPNNQNEVNGIGSYYTEEPVVKEPGSLRDIVIDGCNIAMAYTKNQSFSEAGLKLVIDYFTLKGHTVKVFVPQHKRCMQHTLLESLYSEGIVVFTPSRKIGGRRISSYDDRYILDYATMCDGIVVSLDQYRDLYGEKPEWKNIIENRLLVPTFVGRCVMFPEDPLGRTGPKLDEFLRH